MIEKITLKEIKHKFLWCEDTISGLSEAVDGIIQYLEDKESLDKKEIESVDKIESNL